MSLENQANEEHKLLLEFERKVRMYEEQGKLAEAEIMLQTLKNNNTTRYEPHKLSAEFYIRQGNKEEASKNLDLSIMKGNKNPETLEQLININKQIRAERLAAENNTNKSRNNNSIPLDIINQTKNKIIKLDEELNKTNYFSEIENIEIKINEEIIELHNKDKTATHAINLFADHLFRINDINSAMSLYLNSIAINKEQSEIIHKFLDNTKNDQTLAITREYMQNIPNRKEINEAKIIRSLFEEAESLVKNGNYQKSEAVISLATHMYKNNHLLEKELGKREFFFRDNIHTTERLLSKSLEINPYDEEALKILSIIYLNNNNTEKLKEVTSRLSFNPFTEKDVWFLNGITQAGMRKINEAQNSFINALQINQNDPITHYYLGRTYEYKRDKKAINHLLFAINHGFQYKYAYVRLNGALSQERLYEEAKNITKHIKQKFQLDSTDYLEMSGLTLMHTEEQAKKISDEEFSTLLTGIRECKKEYVINYILNKPFVGNLDIFSRLQQKLGLFNTRQGHFTDAYDSFKIAYEFSNQLNKDKVQDEDIHRRILFSYAFCCLNLHNLNIADKPETEKLVKDHALKYPKNRETDLLIAMNMLRENKIYDALDLSLDNLKRFDEYNNEKGKYRHIHHHTLLLRDIIKKAGGIHEVLETIKYNNKFNLKNNLNDLYLNLLESNTATKEDIEETISLISNDERFKPKKEGGFLHTLSENNRNVEYIIENNVFTARKYVVKTTKKYKENLFKEFLIEKFVFDKLNPQKSNIKFSKEKKETEALIEAFAGQANYVFTKTVEPLLFLEKGNESFYFQRRTQNPTIQDMIYSGHWLSEIQATQLNEKSKEDYDLYTLDLGLKLISNISELHEKTRNQYTRKENFAIIEVEHNNQTYEVKIPLFNPLQQIEQRLIHGKETDTAPRVGTNKYSGSLIEQIKKIINKPTHERLLHGDLAETNITYNGEIIDMENASIGDITHDISYAIISLNLDKQEDKIINHYVQTANKLQPGIININDVMNNYYPNKIINRLSILGARIHQKDYIRATHHTKKALEEIENYNPSLNNTFKNYLFSTTNQEFLNIIKTNI